MTQYLFIIMILIGAGYAWYYGRKAKIEIEEFNQKKINQKRIEKKIEYLKANVFDEMELRILNLLENKADKLFKSNDCQTLLKMYDDFYPKIGFNLPWVAYLILQQNQVVGLGIFKGQPKEGKVEIAYWTFNGFEGQGIASFACKELITISQKADPKLIVTATTAPEQNASTKILENNEFVFKEIVQDEEIGDAWLWTLKME